MLFELCEAPLAHLHRGFLGWRLEHKDLGDTRTRGTRKQATQTGGQPSLIERIRRVQSKGAKLNKHPPKVSFTSVSMYLFRVRLVSQTEPFVDRVQPNARRKAFLASAVYTMMLARKRGRPSKTIPKTDEILLPHALIKNPPRGFFIGMLVCS